MTNNKKVYNRAHAKSDMMERGDPLFVPSFHKNLRRVRLLPADSSLLQQTECVNTKLDTVLFSQ